MKHTHKAREYQVLPAASGYWHLYELAEESTHYVGRYRTKQDALDAAEANPGKEDP